MVQEGGVMVVVVVDTVVVDSDVVDSDAVDLDAVDLTLFVNQASRNVYNRD